MNRLDHDEEYAIEQTVYEDHETEEALLIWAEQSARGRSPRVDKELCDRLEYLMEKHMRHFANENTQDEDDFI